MRKLGEKRAKNFEKNADRPANPAAVGRACLVPDNPISYFNFVNFHQRHTDALIDTGYP